MVKNSPTEETGAEEEVLLTPPKLGAVVVGVLFATPKLGAVVLAVAVLEKEEAAARLLGN